MIDPVAVVRSYLTSFDGRDPDAIAAHVGDGFVNDHASALGTPSGGAAEYRRRLPGFLEQMPDLHYEVTRIVADGGDVAAAYTLTARPDDTAVELRGLMLFEVTAGRITRRTDYWDSLGFLRQTGQA